MKKVIIIVLVVVLVTATIFLSIFAVNQIKIHRANEETSNIVVGDIIKNIELTEQKEIKNDDIIGKLTIPDILLIDAPIRESVELSTLSQAIGHFTSTSLYEGNVGLASHNSGSSGTYFKDLYKIKKGNEIYYETNYGTKKYVVETITEIEETDFSYLQETKDNRITLITCVKNKPNLRLCVQAVEK